jgi:small subunit ribosomal protein S7
VVAELRICLVSGIILLEALLMLLELLIANKVDQSTARKSRAKDSKMPRRREVEKRDVLPDPKFNNKLVARFVNSLLKRRKKSVAESILYGAFDIMEKKLKEQPVELFEKAVNNVKPVIEVKSRRVGGSTYQVPTEVVPARRTALAIRWLITNAQERTEKTMREKLAGELIDAVNNRGGAIKKRESVHKMAEANKAFAHYKF